MKQVFKRVRYTTYFLRHWIILFVVAVLAAYILRPKPHKPLEIRSLTPADLCERAFNGDTGFTARVPFRHLEATSDPRVYELHPGHPPEFFAPTIRIEFAEVPQAIPIHPIVIGIVSRIDPDDKPRKSRHLGIVVLTDCRVAPTASP